MPTYRYRCDSCHKEKEIEQKISDPAISSCPFCSEDSLKRIPPKEVSIQFKGSGFYKTDYPGSNSSDNKPKGGCGTGGCGCH